MAERELSRGGDGSSKKQRQRVDDSKIQMSPSTLSLQELAREAALEMEGNQWMEALLSSPSERPSSSPTPSADYRELPPTTWTTVSLPYAPLSTSPTISPRFAKRKSFIGTVIVIPSNKLQASTSSAEKQSKFNL